MFFLGRVLIDVLTDFQDWFVILVLTFKTYFEASKLAQKSLKNLRIPQQQKKKSIHILSITINKNRKKEAITINSISSTAVTQSAISKRSNKIQMCNSFASNFRNFHSFRNEKFFTAYKNDSKWRQQQQQKQQQKREKKNCNKKLTQPSKKSLHLKISVSVWFIAVHRFFRPLLLIMCCAVNIHP